jgi:transcriptional regulator with GAF, ATPase, and Fis domain
LNRQRGSLLMLGGILLSAMCAALVLLSFSVGPDGTEVSFEGQWLKLVGIMGLVLLFILYGQKKHRELVGLESRMREMAVREASLHARFSELSFLFDTSTQLQLRLDLQGMLDLAVQRLIPCLDAHQASIMLFEPESGTLEVKAAAGVDAGLVAGAKVKPGEGIAGHVFTSGESLLLTPELMQSRFSSEIKRGREISSGLCVPMQFRGSTIGVVNVSRAAGVESFSAMHARMLEAFAGHCAATVLKTHHHQALLEQVRKAA